MSCAWGHAAEDIPVSSIQLNPEPKFKDGGPQTVRTLLTKFNLDGYSTMVFFYEFGDKKVGIETLIAKKIAVQSANR
jgi:hypothetical protein